jgi:hypothetical protein
MKFLHHFQNILSSPSTVKKSASCPTIDDLKIRDKKAKSDTISKELYKTLNYSKPFENKKSMKLVVSCFVATYNNSTGQQHMFSHL